MLQYLIHLCLTAWVVLVLSACQATIAGPAGSSTETIRIGLPPLEQNALIYIAGSQGYFKQNGLSVTIQDYDSGVTSMNALRQNQVDLAVAAEFPVVHSLLNKDPVMIVASMDKFENDFIVARKDRGIAQIQDLKGKRIGVALQTINEFYLGRFLELNQLRLDDVTLVNLKPAEFVQAIASGKVDAIIAWQPFVSQIEQKVPDVLIWPGQNSQPVYSLLIARQPWLTDNPQAATRFLKALLQAEDFLLRQPEKSKAIIGKQLNYSDAYLASIWPEHEYALTLDNSLIVAMTDEARWLIRNRLSTETSPPEFYQAIYLDGLHLVKPEAVDIHR